MAALGIVLGAATLGVLGLTYAMRGLVVPVDYWLPVLIALFAVTEGFVVHLRVRRGSHGMSISEIPLVLALVHLDPLLVVGARVVGGGLGLLLLRGQRGLKLGFNLSLWSVQASVAALTFVGLGGAGVPRRFTDWLAIYAAVLLADTVAAILVTAAIALHDDPGEWRRLPSALRGEPFVLITTSLGIVAAIGVARTPWTLVLLGVVSVVLYLAYRAFVTQQQGHARVDELYAFTRALDGSGDTRALIRVVLEQARDQLRAGEAQLIVPALAGHPATRTRLTSRDRQIDTLFAHAPVDDWWAPALAGEPVLWRAEPGALEGPDLPPRDGLAVPVPLADETGVLLVAESMPDVGGFDTEHLRLFGALANHASVALARAHLVDRLRREAEEKEHLALHDPLTGLPNRQHFQALLDESLDATRHDDHGPAVLLLDLDRFKEVNEALGHETGDAVLQEVAARLQQSVADRGQVARLGGDEYAVLLRRVRTVVEAVNLGSDLVRELERPVQRGPLSLSARASIGIAVAPDHGTDAQTLLRRADVAMYAAKTGHTALRVYLPADDQNTPDRLALITDLRDAIDRHDLLVVFQPKLDPHTDTVVGAEALCRWHHPTFGNIPPDQFIPLAEHSGLIRPLTLHVLEAALRRCAAWRRAGHALHVAVNLSPNSLHDPTLPEVVQRLLGQTGVPAGALTLEITESTIMANPAAAEAVLDQLHRLGVRLSIDDFGTGYSSLGRLRELPLHEVKIDRSFVQRVAVDHRDRAVVRSAVQLGHALGLEVVAEGVEDGETYAYLVREGCNVFQGFLISRPLPPDEFAGWLASRSAPNVVRGRFSA
ncbi:putative bifunctional diguanylate cyclase/phosphodiesterase [Pilimelia anulata]|uniref:putative bifunctional diguanylate cyclase/phosphodiesterase n=1 Tax=Pilimelia anulata TaxID=53371 RepID=UPI0016691371|nr:EAL domain-containing protein [Pilimelia anulata]